MRAGADLKKHEEGAVASNSPFFFFSGLVV